MRARTLAIAAGTASLVGGTPAAAQQQPPVVFPQLCVEYEPGASVMQARLSYVNTTGSAVTIFRGSENLFVEPPQNRQQPEVFEPGYHADVFRTTFDPAVGLRFIVRTQMAVLRAEPAMACKQDLGVLAVPAVSGTAAAGAMLATDGGRFGGDPAPELAYQWQRSRPDGGWEDVADATSFAYWALPDDAGRRLRVRVTATNHQGSVVAHSMPTGAVAPPPPSPYRDARGAGPAPPPPVAPVVTSPPAVSGEARVGAVLTATLGEWSATPAPAVSPQWQRCAAESCHDVPGATGATYNPAAMDAGHALRVRVDADNAGGHAAAVSAATPAVTAPPRLSVSGTLAAVRATRHGRTATATVAVIAEHVARVELRVTTLRDRTLKLRPGSALGDRRAAEPARSLALIPREGVPIGARVVLARRALRRAGGAALLRLRGVGAGGEDRVVVPVVAGRRQPMSRNAASTLLPSGSSR